VDDETIAQVLGLRDVNTYAGGMFPVSRHGREILARRCGLQLREDLDYFIEYLQDYPGKYAITGLKSEHSGVRPCLAKR
jgi:hypothetical protein